MLPTVTDDASRPAVRLRDVTLADADLFNEIRRREMSDGGFNDFGLESTPVDRELLAQGPLRDDHNGVLLIERLEDRQVIGTIGWHLVPEARGKGHGTEAQRLIADFLFETTNLHRVEASTDVDNRGEQRSLEKAGYTREGINRKAQFRAGRYHDLVLYARLRSDPR
jgi:RimJ/RimL family protein N-acetyltransferase